MPRARVTCPEMGKIISLFLGGGNRLPPLTEDQSHFLESYYEIIHYGDPVMTPEEKENNDALKSCIARILGFPKAH